MGSRRFVFRLSIVKVRKGNKSFLRKCTETSIGKTNLNVGAHVIWNLEKYKSMHSAQTYREELTHLCGIPVSSTTGNQQMHHPHILS